MIATGIHFGGLEWTGDFTTIDLIAATTNALNGALLARRPDHYRTSPSSAIMLMALLGGLGGDDARRVGRTRCRVRSRTRPTSRLRSASGLIGYLIAFKGGQLFREGLFQFMTSFSLPWYAIAGAQKGSGRPPGPGSPAARRRGSDRRPLLHRCEQRVPPKQFIRGEWFVGIALLTGLIWVICDVGRARPGRRSG